MKIGIIIQARTGSSRLPKKILFPFYKEKSILDIIIEKLKILNNKYQIILATSTSKEDENLKSYSDKFGIDFFKGSENDVLSRFVDAATQFKIDVIIRICSDNPFLDIESIVKLIEIYSNNNQLDYCSFKNFEGLPAIKTHLGLFAEIVSTKALKKIKKLTEEKLFTEHVTNYIYTNPEIFNIHLENASQKVYCRKDLRFTVDDIHDFNNLREVYKEFRNNNFTLDEIIDYVDKNEDIKMKMEKNIKKYSK